MPFARPKRLGARADRASIALGLASLVWGVGLGVSWGVGLAPCVSISVFCGCR